jgi:hypothetical protein
MPLAPVVAGQTIDPTTFGNAVVDELNARGVKGYAQAVANQGPIVAVVDLTGLSVTWTAVSGRFYRITASAAFSSTVGTDLVDLQITDAAGTVQNSASTAVVGVGFVLPLTCTVVQSTLTGSVTRKVRALRAVGTGNITMNAAAARPAFIIVEDLS